MTAGPWIVVNDFATLLEHGSLPLGSGYKVALFQSTSNIAVTSTVYSALTNEVASGNGYTTGGISVTLTDNAATNDAVYFASSPGNPIWTITGSGITAMYGVLYYVSNSDILSYCAVNSVGGTPTNLTVPAGNTFDIESDNTASNPVYTI